MNDGPFTLIGDRSITASLTVQRRPSPGRTGWWSSVWRRAGLLESDFGHRPELPSATSREGVEPALSLPES